MLQAKCFLLQFYRETDVWTSLPGEMVSVSSAILFCRLSRTCWKVLNFICHFVILLYFMITDCICVLYNWFVRPGHKCLFWPVYYWILWHKFVFTFQLIIIITIHHHQRVYLIDDLEKMQKRDTKILRQCRRLNYRKRLKFLNLPTLAFRRNRGDMIEVYKIFTGKYDPTLPSILHHNINSTTRGNPLKLCTYRPKYDLCKYNFTVRVISLWNSLMWSWKFH